MRGLQRLKISLLVLCRVRICPPWRVFLCEIVTPLACVSVQDIVTPLECVSVRDRDTFGVYLSARS